MVGAAVTGIRRAKILFKPVSGSVGFALGPSVGKGK